MTAERPFSGKTFGESETSLCPHWKSEDIQATARNEEGSQHSGLVLRVLRDYIGPNTQYTDCTSFKKELFSMRRRAGLETVGQLLAEQVEKADLVSEA